MAETVRGTALFSGYVQGVGFRFTTRRVAAGFAVTGYVRNLSSGEVEVVAEGTRPEIEAFLDAVGKTMGTCVNDVDVRWSAPTAEFSGFSVRL